MACCIHTRGCGMLTVALMLTLCQRAVRTRICHRNSVSTPADCHCHLSYCCCAAAQQTRWLAGQLPSSSWLCWPRLPLTSVTARPCQQEQLWVRPLVLVLGCCLPQIRATQGLRASWQEVVPGRASGTKTARGGMATSAVVAAGRRVAAVGVAVEPCTSQQLNAVA